MVVLTVQMRVMVVMAVMGGGAMMGRMMVVMELTAMGVTGGGDARVRAAPGPSLAH